MKRIAICLLTIALLAGAQDLERPARPTQAEARAQARQFLEKGSWEEALDSIDDSCLWRLGDPRLRAFRSPCRATLDGEWNALIASAESAGDVDRQLALLQFWVSEYPFFDVADGPDPVDTIRPVEEKLSRLRLAHGDPQGTDARFSFCHEMDALLSKQDFDQVVHRIESEMPAGHASGDGGFCRWAYTRAQEALLDRIPTANGTQALQEAGTGAAAKAEDLFGAVLPSMIIKTWRDPTLYKLACPAVAWRLCYLAQRSSEIDTTRVREAIERVPSARWKRRILLALGAGRFPGFGAPSPPESATGQSPVDACEAAFADLFSAYPDSVEASRGRLLIVEALCRSSHEADAEEYFKTWRSQRPDDDYLDEGLLVLSAVARAREVDRLSARQDELLKDLESHFADRAALSCVWIARGLDALAHGRQDEGIGLLERAAGFSGESIRRPCRLAPEVARGYAYYYLEPIYAQRQEWGKQLVALQGVRDPFPGWCGNGQASRARNITHQIAECYEKLGMIDEALQQWKGQALGCDCNGMDLDALDRYLELSRSSGKRELCAALLQEVRASEQGAKGKYSRERLEGLESILVTRLSHWDLLEAQDASLRDFAGLQHRLATAGR